MAGNDVVLNIRERGARRTSREVDRVGNSVSALSRHGRRGANDLRVFSRASVSATGHLRLLGGAALYGGAALGGVLALGIKKTIDAYEESRKVGLSTNAVISSTGGVAHVTRKQVDALSSSLSRKAGIDDEAIQRGENMLLTFRGIRNEVGKGNDIFNQAARTVVDLSAGMTAMGKPMSVSSAAVLLGKALNDPARGAAALGRTGAIDKAAVERIKQMKEQGASLRTLQKFVLGQVNAQFGGQAAATASPLDKLKVGVQNVEEAIGKGLSPATDAISVKLGHLADDIAPKFDRVGTQIAHIFDRKDLDFNQKLGLTGNALSHTLRPYEKQFGREIKKLHLGDKLAAGIEYAMPKLADAAAKAAPKAAEAFVHGWLHAGVWGKLLTLGILEKKTGVLGGLLGRGMGGMGVRGPVGAGTLTNPIAVVTEGGGMGPGIPGLTGTLRRFLPILGWGAAAYGMYKAGTSFASGITDLATAPLQANAAVDADPHVRGMRSWMKYARKHRLYAKWRRNASPGMRYADKLYGDISAGPLPPGNTPSGRHAQAYLIRRQRQLESYLRGVGDPLFAPRNAAEAKLLNVNVFLDGKGIAHQLTVTRGRELERGVRRVQNDRDARR